MKQRELMKVGGELGGAVLGAAAFGAASGVGHGAAAVLRGAWAVPAVFVAGAILAAPPLFLLTAMAGARVPIAKVADASGKSLADACIVLFGLAPAAAFFSTTLHTGKGSMLLLAAGGAVGALAVFAAMVRTLSDEKCDRVRLAGAIWTVLAMLIGARLIGTVGHAAGLFGGA